MEQYGRTCDECGRNLPPAYLGDLCAMCRQAGAEAQARPAPCVTGGGQDLAQEAAYSAPVTLNMLAPHYQREIRDLAGLERINAVLWIVIATLQIVSMVFALVGLYNIVVCINSFRRAKAYEDLEPGIPEQEQHALGSIILFTFINLFLGGVIGVVSCILALVIRSRILKLREAFENPQACLDRQTYGAW